MYKAKEIQWRRGMVLRLSAQGYKQEDIARILHLSRSVVSRDLSYLRKQAQQNISYYITQSIPETIDRAFTLLDYILTQCTEILQNAKENKLKVQVMSLMCQVQHSKIELLADTTIAKEIIKDWRKKQEKLLLSSNGTIL
jgi:predicted transcriptional regulator